VPLETGEARLLQYAPCSKRLRSSGGPPSHQNHLQPGPPPGPFGEGSSSSNSSGGNSSIAWPPSGLPGMGWGSGCSTCTAPASLGAAAPSLWAPLPLSLPLDSLSLGGFQSVDSTPNSSINFGSGVLEGLPWAGASEARGDAAMPPSPRTPHGATAAEEQQQHAAPPRLAIPLQW
jgi:hypothetical protein